MAQQTKQLVTLMNHYTIKGDLTNGKKIAQKLLQSHTKRLKQLATIDIDNSNSSAVMAELNEIEYLTK